jgi:FMN hydrolase / 5-amino-6-(5-phospho-D-ribitylamino)uracil phosphatase
MEEGDEIVRALAGLTTLLFDADGTLWDFEGAMRHALACALAELERLYPADRGRLTVDALIAIRERVAADVQGRPWRHEEIRLEAFRRTLATLGHPGEALARDITAVFMRHRFADIALYDDVLPALDALQERYALGLLTNGNTAPERCGLPGRFRFVILSQDHALQKPDQRLFALAIERAGCRPQQMVNIGDSLGKDVRGAQQAGLPAIWLNRGQKPNPTGIVPDAEIAGLGGLLAILQPGTL